MLRELLKEVSKDRFIEYMNGISRGIDKSFIHVLKPKYIILHVLGAVLALPIMFFGLDWMYFRVFQSILWLQLIFFTAPPLGGYIPIFVPAALYLHGKKHNKPYLFPFAFVLTQAGLVALFWSSLYKSITGRVGPEVFENTTKDYSLDFAFGILRRGIFEGWPSAHTSIAWSMVVTLWICLPKLHERYKVDNLDQFDIFWLKIRRYSLLYAIFISIAVSTNIHWLSDVIMGIFVGISTGLATSRVFLEIWDETKLDEKSTPRVRNFSILIFFLVFFSLWGLDDIL